MGMCGEFTCGEMSRSGLMWSWLKVMRGCVKGVRPGVGRMGEVVGMKPLSSAVSSVGLEGVVPMAS
jgi:uncharacterized membrane protein